MFRNAPSLPAAVPLALLPLAFLLQNASLAADVQVTPGSVLHMIAPDAPRMPATRAQVLLPAQPAPSPHEPRGRRFQVNSFDFAGNTVFSTFMLKRVVERYLDMELNLYDLNRAADTITGFYHQRGYTLARAVIPAQQVVDGTVQLRIIEGRIDTVVFSGNRRFSERFLRAWTAPLRPGTLVTTDRLESTLLLMNDIPGLDTKVLLEPGADFGTSTANLQVAEKMYSGSVGLNNHGRSDTGQNKLDLSLNLDSPFGWGDQLALAASSTEHELVRYWKVAYSLPLNQLGTRMSIGDSTAAYAVSGAVAALGIAGDVRTTDVSVSHPLARGRNDSRWMSLAVKHSRLTQTALGLPVSDTTINVLTASGLLNHIDDDGALTTASFSLATNFKSVGSRRRQDALFARMEADVSYTTPFVQRWDLYLRGNIVHSKEMLPDSEKFSLGGPGSIRAFRPSEVRGDSGYQAKAELRRPFSFASRAGSLRVTADIGEVIYKTPLFKDSRDRLRSVGLGANFYPGAGTTVSLDAARQLGKSGASTDGRKNRIWISVNANF